jgi:hypothetical protein
VRAMAVWALSKLAPEQFAALREARSTAEPDQVVAAEWTVAS